MKKKLLPAIPLLMAMMLLFNTQSWGQIFETNFNVEDSWDSPDGGAMGSYNDKTYAEGDWFFESTQALRGSSDESFGGSPYSFRDRGIFTVRNTEPVSNVEGFSLQLRDWMAGDGVDREINISYDGGNSWENIATIDKDWFDEYQVYQEFTYSFPDGESDFIAEEFQIEITGGDESNDSRINIGQFVALGEPTFVATPTFDPDGGTFYEPVDVTIETATEGATIHYSTEGDEGPWTEYTAPVTLDETTSLWAYAEADDLDDSQVASAEFTFPQVVEVDNVAALRAGEEDGTVYRLTGEAILTYQQDFRSKKWIQDENAAIEIDDNEGIIATEYSIYDGITGITGTLTRHNNMLQFIPVTDPGAATSTGNTPTIVTRSLEDLEEADQARLVLIENVSFDEGDAGDNFSTGANYDIYDPSGMGIFRTNFFDADYIGEPIPETPQNITAIVFQFHEDMQVTARNWDDFELIHSIYAFSYDLPTEDIYPEQEVDVDVTFETVEEGTMGYEGVRFAIEAAGPGDVTFAATDSEGNEHSFENEAFWGPSSGIDIPADYTATTEWSLEFSEDGEYSITFSLIEAPEGDVIDGITDQATIQVEPIPEGPLAEERIFEGSTTVSDVDFSKMEGQATLTLYYVLDQDSIITGDAHDDLEGQVPGEGAPEGYGYHEVVAERPTEDITHFSFEGFLDDLEWNEGYQEVRSSAGISGVNWYLYVAIETEDGWTPMYDHDYSFTISWYEGETLVAIETLDIDVVDESYIETPSEYAFSFEVPDPVMPEEEILVPVTFETIEEGHIGYEGVRFAIDADGPGDVSFAATDSEGNEHSFENEGFWGPASGFDLPADYTATTDWTLEFSQEGEYTITFSLIEAPDGDIVDDITDEATIFVEPIPEGPLAEERIFEGSTTVSDVDFSKMEGQATLTLYYVLDQDSIITGDAHDDLEGQVPGEGAPQSYGYHEVVAQRPSEDITHFSFEGFLDDLEWNEGYQEVRSSAGISGVNWYLYVAIETEDGWVPMYDHDYSFTISWYEGETLVAIETLAIDVVDESYIETPSEYAFSFDVPAPVLPNEEITVPVTFETVEVGHIGYEGVRFAIEADGPGDVSFAATDSEGNAHSFENEGFWGPASGFDLPADYTATTDWTLEFSQEGEYTITFSLIEAPEGDIVDDITDQVVVDVTEDDVLPGSDCENPIIVDVYDEPLEDFEVNSEDYPNNFNSSMSDPTSSYLNGHNIVFEFTLTDYSLVSASIAGSWTGLHIFATCPSEDDPAEILASGHGFSGGSVEDELLEEGTYFMIVGTYPSPDYTDMTISLSAEETSVHSVTFVVEDEEGVAIDDATITLDGMTNDEGDYVFETLFPDLYNYTVTAPGYLEETGTVEVIDADLTETVVMEEAPVYTVTFMVEDEEGVAIDDATITLDGETNTQGDYVFEGIEAGTYNYVVSAEGYTSEPGSVEVVDEDITELVVMSEAFIVTDFPWFEGFEEDWTGTPAAPENWTVINGVDGSYWQQHSTAYSGDYSARSYNGFASSNQADEWLISPALDLDDPEASMLLFYGYSSQSPDGVKENMRIMIMDDVYFNTDDLHANATLIDVIPFSSEWEAYLIDLSDYSGIKHIAFNYYITAEDNASFNWIYVDDVTVGEFDTFTLSMLEPVGEGTVIPAEGDHDFLEDTEVGISAEADYTWSFEYWEVNGEFYSAEPDTVITMTEDIDVQAFFIDLESFTLTMLDPEGEGTVTPEVGAHDYLENDEVALSADPDYTWAFEKWEVDGEFYSDAADTTIVMTEDVEVKAYFIELDTYTLTMLDPVGEGTVSPDTGDHVYVEDEEVSITANADYGWAFEKWEVNGEFYSNESDTILVMTEDKDVQAFFYELEVYTLTMEDPVGQGTVNPEPGDHDYLEGDEVSLTATPGLGWEFSHWVGAVEDTDTTETSILMDQDHTVTAHFSSIDPTDLPFTEDFSDISVGELPEKWNRTHSNWGVWNTSHAGGEAPELRLNWSPSVTDTVMAITPQLDATGQISLTLTFLHHVNDFGGDYTLKVQTSTDGETWTDQWELFMEKSNLAEGADRNANGRDVGPEMVTLNLDDLAGEEFFIAFVFDGNTYNINRWNIDNIFVGEPVTEHEVTFMVAEDSDDEDPLEGAIISINGFDDLTTDQDGQATIDLEDGTYTADITMSGYEDEQVTFTVDGQDKTVEVHMMDVIEEPFNLDIVTEGLDEGEALFSWEHGILEKVFVGFNVFLNGNLVAEEIEDTEYLFTDLPEGEHTAGVQSVYTTGSSDVVEIEFQIEIEPELYTVTFNVMDEAGDPIADAIVTFDGQQYDAGEYVFTDIEPGTYDYSVSKEGYHDAAGEVAVVDENVEVEVTLVEEEPETYTVYFTVTDEEGENIPDAVITFDGVEYDPGVYEIEEVEAGMYDYVVSHEDYKEATGEVEVIDQDVVVDVVLEEPVGISDPSIAGLTLYPNPARTTLKISADETIEEIRVVDILGQVVYAANVESREYQLNVSGFDNGVYFVQIRTSEGLVTERVQVSK